MAAILTVRTSFETGEVGMVLSEMDWKTHGDLCAVSEAGALAGAIEGVSRVVPVDGDGCLPRPSGQLLTARPEDARRQYGAHDSEGKID